jgi:hypothetical protein
VVLVLDLYTDFLAAHVTGEYAWPSRRLAEFVVRRMGPVFEWQGDRLTGLDATLSALEATVSEPAQVRLVRAEYDLQQTRATGTTSTAIADKARQALESLAAEGTGMPCWNQTTNSSGSWASNPIGRPVWIVCCWNSRGWTQT